MICGAGKGSQALTGIFSQSPDVRFLSGLPLIVLENKTSGFLPLMTITEIFKHSNPGPQPQTLQLDYREQCPSTDILKKLPDAHQETNVQPKPTISALHFPLDCKAKKFLRPSQLVMQLVLT